MKLALIVPCAICGAEPGQPCRNRTGRTSKQIHADRRSTLSMHRLYSSQRPRIRWRDRPAGRELLAAADGQPCPLCDEPIWSEIAHLDHIVPFGIGGIDDPINLRVICRRCNNGRSKRGVDVNLAGALAAGLIEPSRAWTRKAFS